MKKECEMCGKEFVIKGQAYNTKYCSECRQDPESRKSYRRKVKMKIKKPKITIQDVGRFQTKFKEKTGVWLSYNDACKMLESEDKQ